MAVTCPGISGHSSDQLASHSLQIDELLQTSGLSYLKSRSSFAASFEGCGTLGSVPRC